MIDFVICDDNEFMVKKVNKVVEDVCCKYDVSANCINFIDYDDKFNKFLITNSKTVVFIMDIDMPSESGIDVAKRIRKTDKDSVIIFLTSHNELVYDIIKEKLNILTFISKASNCIGYLTSAIKLSLSYVEKCKFIIFSDAKSNYKINLKDILYITKEARKTMLVTTYKTFLVSLPMNKIQDLLTRDFIQTHRACIVNSERVSRYDRVEKIIYFDNDTQTDLVSEKYKRNLVLE